MLKAISTITNALGALNYKGTWNASSNTPTLADGTGAKGDYYVVSTAGTQTFGGVQLFFGLGDWIAYNGAVWQRVEGGSDGNFANVTLTSTDAGATASPLLELYRDSASPAASDTLGEIEFNGEDSAGNKQAYGLIHASILSPTSTAEQGQLHFETATAGALTEKMIIGTSNLVINEIGAVFNVRIEGDTDANLFYTDATNSRVGVGILTPAEKLDVVGNIKLTGNVVVANGQGVDFSATSGTGTSELFDDYEIGLHTTTANANTTLDNSYKAFKYTKVGNVVTVVGLLQITGSSGSDVLTFTLPFTAAADPTGGQNRSVGGCLPYNATTGTGGMVPFVQNNTAIMNLYKISLGVATNSGYAAATNADVINGSSINFNITYLST